LHITQSVQAFVLVLEHAPDSSDKSSFEIIFEKSVRSGRALFFQGYFESLGEIQNTTLNSTLNPYSTKNVALGSFDLLLCTVLYWVDYHVFSVFCGALPITFWLATKNFELTVSDACESKETVDGRRLLHKFKDLKIVTRLINSIWSTLVLNFVMFFALRLIYLHQYNRNGNKIQFVHRCINILFGVVGLVLFAEGCRFVSPRHILYLK